MEDNDRSARNTQKRGGGVSLPAVVLIVLLTAAGALYAGRTILAPDIAVENAAQPTSVPFLAPQPTSTPAVRAEAVTQQIQGLKKLVTTTYHMQVVVERSEAYPGALGTRDTVLLIAGGTVVAGVDLDKITASDIQVLDNGTRVRVQLPPIEIFPFTGLDEDTTRIYRHDTPPTFRPIDDLETRARQDAVDEIIRAACKDGIMDTTTKQARESVELFLKSVGIPNPEVVSASPPACPVALEPTPTPKP